MKYKLKLQCKACGRQSNDKLYDKTEQEMKQIFQVCKRALMMPEHIICPQCHSLISVQPVVQKC